MKIVQKNIKGKHKLVYLQILKSKLYKKESLEKIKKEEKYDKIKLYFKKIAHVVYEYHVNNKKILFLNFPKTITKKINSIIFKTRHVAVTNLENINVISKINEMKSLAVLENFNLIVMFNYNNSSSFASLGKQFPYIPVITINSSYFETLGSNFTYRIPGNFKFIENQVSDWLFLCILRSIFKQATIKKKLFSVRKRLKFKLIKRKRKRYGNLNFSSFVR